MIATTQPTVRTCAHPGCETRLSRYNDSEFCALHEPQPEQKTTVAGAADLEAFLAIEDDDEAAWAYLGRLNEYELRAQLFPHVHREIVKLRRQRIVRPQRQPRESAAAVDLLAQRDALMRETFVLSDGTRVRWLQATPAQHRDRAMLQRRLAGQYLEEAQRHEAAAELIEQRGVTCLAEIEP